MKYTDKKINQALKDLDKVKKYQEKSRGLTIELERTYKRIKFAMIFDFKKYLKDRLNEISTEVFENFDEFLYKNPKGIAKMKAKKIHERELTKIYPYRFDRYEDLIWTVIKIQKTDREHYIKSGEISK